ncbi:MAG TPA: NAD(P)-dependent oxidoreductase [Ktedonobacteraceae bacterium]|nr:NAD(P)-dependent oxidoreductase [Ktedonobacteraceae bacterium]
MKVLLTGASGNIGGSTWEELCRQGHQVRCFMRPSRTNRRKAQRMAGKAEIAWGDLRNRDEVKAAVQDQEVVVHLAFVIPPLCLEQPEVAREVNVEGTRYLIEAARSLEKPPKFLFASSLDVFGRTQDQEPPRKVTDPVFATDAYTEHKLACESMLKSSGLEWSIFRFSDVPPLALRSPHPIMFEIPLNTRFEMVHPYDAALAIANGIRSEEIWGRIWLIGGGKSCQVYYRDYLNRMLDLMGIGSLPAEAFTTKPYCTDWLDTEDSQHLLAYQRYTFDDILAGLARIARFQRLLARPSRFFVRRWMLNMSPYWKQARAQK